MSVLFGIGIALGMLLTLLVAATPAVMDFLDARADRAETRFTDPVATPGPAA